MARHWARLSAALAVLLGSATVCQQASAASGPQVNLSSSAAAPGAELTVTGTGFSRMQNTSTSVCGADGTAGSAGCDLNDQVTFLTDRNGDFRVAVRIGLPPVPCPCALVVDSGDTEVTVPIAIPGARVMPVKTATVTAGPVLKVADVRLTGGGIWPGWFGGAAHRTLTFALYNSGSESLSSTPVTLQLRSPLGGETTINAPVTGILGAGQSRTFRIPVDLGALAIGGFRVNGQIESFGNPVRFTTSTFAMPWVLLLIALAMLQLLLLRIRNLARARIHRADPAPGSESPADPDLTSHSDEMVRTAAQIEHALAASGISDPGQTDALFVPTANRLILRSAILSICTLLGDTRQAVLELASRPRDKGGIDLLSIAGTLERVNERLMEGYRRINSCGLPGPHGDLAARQLGFDPTPDETVRLDGPSLIEQIHDLTSPLELLAVQVTLLCGSVAGDQEAIEPLLLTASDVHRKAQAYTATAFNADALSADILETLATLPTPDGVRMLQLTTALCSAASDTTDNAGAVLSASDISRLVARWERLNIDRSALADIQQSLSGVTPEVGERFAQPTAGAVNS